MAIAVEKSEGTVTSFTVHKVDPQQSIFLTTLGVGKLAEIRRLAEIGRKYFPQREQAGKKLMDELRHPLNTAVLLKKSMGLIIGYAYASNGLDRIARVQEVSIDSEVNEVGGLERMITELEDELLRGGLRL